MQFSKDLRSASSKTPASDPGKRVGYMEGSVSGTEAAALAKLFPELVLEPLGTSWPRSPGGGLSVLIAGVNAASNTEVEQAIGFLRANASAFPVVVALRNADVSSSRILTRAGAADIVPVPASDAAWALALERALARETANGEARKSGEVVALLKAGGGVGATSLGVQAAHVLAARDHSAAKICFADMDLQFGTAALYFDMDEILTVKDCVAVGEVLEETQFATVLAAHKSGTRLLAAPREVTSLDILTPSLVDGLISGLRRDFPLTILDLPSAWTAWTNQVLQRTDRIVLVTRLSVGHVHLVRRQLSTLALLGLDKVPLTLVCNAVTAEQQKLLAIKAAERALGRPFDLVILDDARVMDDAVARGVAIADIKRGTKLEKSIVQLADVMAADALATALARR